MLSTRNTCLYTLAELHSDANISFNVGSVHSKCETGYFHLVPLSYTKEVLDGLYPGEPDLPIYIPKGNIWR